jgi:hypothetical protein
MEWSLKRITLKVGLSMRFLSNGMCHLSAFLLMFGTTNNLTAQAAIQTTTPAETKTESSAAPAPATASVKPNTLLDGTPIRLSLQRNVSSADAHVGDQVDFDVVEEVKVDGVVVIPKGSVALATVTAAEHKKTMGRGGKLEMNVDSVRLADQEKAALRATQGGKGGGHVGAMTTAMVVTGVLFFPAAPLFLFVHGKDITIPKGTETTAYVAGDMPLNMAKFTPPAAPPAAPATAGNTQVAIEASQPDCEIEVDGAFVGNTPSQVALTPERHTVVVKKTGFTPWTKTLVVSGTSVHLHADLEAAPAQVPVPAAQ